MSVDFAGYTFQGPFSSPDHLEDRSGVYAVICSNRGQNRLIDVGEAGEVKSRLETHERKNCWQKNCTGTITYAAHYTPNVQQTGRIAIEQEIRRQYDPPCGER